MNHFVNYARIIILIAIVRLIANNLQYHLMASFKYDDYVNVIYFPAGISALALLIFSYPAAFGILTGSLIWTLLRRDFGPLETIMYACSSTIAVTSAYFCVRTYLKYTNRTLSWSQYTLPILTAYFTLNAAFNSVLHAIGLNSIINPTPVNAKIIALKFIGDVAGSSLLFIGLNLIAILYLRFANFKQKNHTPH